MTFSQFLSILKARWASAAAVLILTVLTAVIVTLLLPKQYTATSAVVIDIKSPDPIAGMVFGAMTAPSYMATQIDIIQSDRVAQEVVRALKLTESAELRNNWLASTKGQGDFAAWTGAVLRAKLQVKPSRDSNVLSISYSATDPTFAAALANAFVKSYLQTSLELRVSPAKQYSSFFDNQAKELRDSLEKAQARLSTYQKEHGIVANDERLDTENQRLTDLTSQLVTIQAIAAESQSRNAQVRGSGDQLQDVISNPVVAGLRADIARLEARLQELNARLGDAHPQVAELKANLAEMRQRMEAEIRRVGGSVGVSNAINKDRAADVRGALEAQRSKVLKMRDQRDAVLVLTKDVESAQRAYDMVFQRLTQTSLESQSNQTNIAVLAPATVPPSPSSPNMTTNVALSVAVGLLLAVGIALVSELLDRRVRSASDISELINVPVLGTLPKPVKSVSAGRSNTLLLPSNLLGRLPSPGR
jgi:polysaccharide biosynthesis transport protein